MRLLKTAACLENDAKLEMVEVWGKSIPEYAIFSHLWSRNAADEISFADVQHNTYRTKPGFAKLEQVLSRAAQDGFDFLWIDTCCIDKTSSAELSEAINSMYRYYHESAICYVFMADVFDVERDFFESRYWRRGWTLQELIAPLHVQFFSATWTSIGFREELASLICQITGIDQHFLLHEQPVQVASVAKRMSWAASRETTREEDAAYCLMGIFDVNMSMLYGEGETKAFLRLQEEILRSQEDHSIFAWVDLTKGPNDECGMLAENPRCFKNAGNVVSYGGLTGKDFLPAMTARGLHINLAVRPYRNGSYLALLNCPVPDRGNNDYLTVYLRRVQNSGDCEQYTRVRPADLGASIKSATPEVIYVRQSALSVAKTIFPLHLFLLQRQRVKPASDMNTVVAQYTAGDILIQPKIAWIEINAPWCHLMRRFHKVDKRSNVLAAALRMRSEQRKDDFLILLGSGSRELTVGFDAVDFDNKITPQFSELSKNFAPRAIGQWVELNHRSVCVTVEERILDAMKIYEVTIDVVSRLDGSTQASVETTKAPQGRSIFQKVGRLKNVLGS